MCDVTPPTVSLLGDFERSLVEEVMMVVPAEVDKEVVEDEKVVDDDDVEDDDNDADDGNDV